mmetsp:Transcript_37249/g.48175  ORF Transcript_37249/g.48175 Transcript_37249/m.48175 type:complete len:365 (-) Transcript_37249:291-1385(-)
MAAQTNEEFLAEIAKREAEEAEQFKAAVAEWRESRAAGGGEAKIMEKGGDFNFTPNESEVEPAVVVKDLTFSFTGHTKKDVLRDMNMNLAPGSRCLLIGRNGAGKSTLLRILAGKHMTNPDGAVRVLGKDAFRDLSLNQTRAFMDTNWGLTTVAFAGYGCPLMADIEVGKMMEQLQSEWPERRAMLIDLLGIDLKWHMHQVSDGQRRRVQLFLGLLRPFNILLLDEVTTALDVVVRQDLLKWLKKESIENGATIVYATHIFDGLDDWPTHLHYLNNHGGTGWQGKLEENEHYFQLRTQGHPSPMLKVAERWLRTEIEEQKAKNEFKYEAASGPAGLASNDGEEGSTPFLNAGGFAPGRMYTRYA